MARDGRHPRDEPAGYSAGAIDWNPERERNLDAHNVLGRSRHHLPPAVPPPPSAIRPRSSSSSRRADPDLVPVPVRARPRDRSPSQQYHREQQAHDDDNEKYTGSPVRHGSPPVHVADANYKYDDSPVRRPPPRPAAQQPVDYDAEYNFKYDTSLAGRRRVADEADEQRRRGGSARQQGRPVVVYGDEESVNGSRGGSVRDGAVRRPDPLGIYDVWYAPSASGRRWEEGERMGR